MCSILFAGWTLFHTGYNIRETLKITGRTHIVKDGKSFDPDFLLADSFGRIESILEPSYLSIDTFQRYGVQPEFASDQGVDFAAANSRQSNDGSLDVFWNSEDDGIGFPFCRT